MNNNKFVFIFFRGLGYFFAGFKRNIFTLLTIATLIFVYHIFFTTGVGTAKFLSHISQANAVRVYLKTGAELDIDKTIEQYKTISGVRDVTYTTPAEAKQFVIENAPTVVGLQALSDEFFPAYFELYTDNGTNDDLMDDIVKEATIPEAESVSYGKDYISKFSRISFGASMFITFISMLFALSISFVIFNTVKLSLFRFKDEIKLYGLVGATRMFISVPYIIEAFFNALTAFLFSTAVFVATFALFNSSILQSSGINVFTMPSATYFIIVLLLICVMSTLAAAVSVVSFLRRVSSVNED